MSVSSHLNVEFYIFGFNLRMVLGQLFIFYIMKIIWLLFVIKFLSSSFFCSLTSTVSALILMKSEWFRFLLMKSEWFRCFISSPFPARLETGTHSSLISIIAEYTECLMLWIWKVLCAKWSRHLKMEYLVVIGFLEMNLCLDRKCVSRISSCFFQFYNLVALWMSRLFFNNIMTIS